MIKDERRIKIKNKNSTQEWLPFDKILENGIIVRKNSYIKIIKIIPINYDLKSNLEKEAILNSYKLFLKTCDFNIQIVIQNKKIKEISEKYVNFIKNKNEENKSSLKNFYIIIKYNFENTKEIDDIKLTENIASNYLKECYFKIKDSLSRCGNIIYDINQKKYTEKILLSFFDSKYSEI